MFSRLFDVICLDNETEAALATVLSTTDVNSSITVFDFNLRAKSALNFSPLDNT
jgi:hypothetical protein